MMNSMIRTVKMQKTNLFWLFGGTLAAAMAGMLLTVLVVTIGDDLSAEVPLGTIFAMGVAVFIYLGVIIFSFTSVFNIAISLGDTRRSCVGCYQIISIVTMFILAAELRVILAFERFLYRMFFAQNTMEINLEPVFQLKYLVPLFAAVWAVAFLLEAIILRFGTKVNWVIWAVYMAIALSVPRLIDNGVPTRFEGIFSKIAEVFEAGGPVLWAAAELIVVGIIAFVSWNILRKQQVTA